MKGSGYKIYEGLGILDFLQTMKVKQKKTAHKSYDKETEVKMGAFHGEILRERPGQDSNLQPTG